VRKNEFYDSIEYFVFFRDDARDCFNDRLTNLVLDDLEEIDALRIRCFFIIDVVEIDCCEREKEEIDQTLNFCSFDENHDVV
jgi:hypothetical protein